MEKVLIVPAVSLFRLVFRQMWRSDTNNQGLGGLLIDRIDGSYDNCVG